MRNDMDSLKNSVGRCCAQSSHAANQCVYEAKKIADVNLAVLLKDWELSTQTGFGTCIVLAVKEAQLRQIIAMAQEAGLHANITHDPTYPLQDGETLHLIPVDTCGYVFARKDDMNAKTILDGLSLL